MRLVAGALFIVLTILSGGFFISSYSFWSSGTYLGHTGYCAETKLPYFHDMCVGILGACLVMIVNYIVVETFSQFRQQQKIYERLLPLFLLPLVYVTYQVAQYTYVNRNYGFMGHSGRNEGFHNPMMFFGAIYALVLGWTIFRFSVKTGVSKKHTITGYILVGGFLITDIGMYLTAKYISCFG